jgi:hypothetical protein
MSLKRAKRASYGRQDLRQPRKGSGLNSTRCLVSNPVEQNQQYLLRSECVAMIAHIVVCGKDMGLLFGHQLADG